MSKVQKISVALTSDMLATVREAVASGDYASTSEIIREALRGWRNERTEIERIAEIRALVAERDASGYRSYDGIDTVKQRGRDRFARK